MKLSKKELENIAKALNLHYGSTINGDFTINHLDNVAVIKNYTPDCPAWCGDIALVVHGGGSCFKDILYKINGEWTWVESMNEGDYEVNKEVL
tara:strand:+ start:341 stop:619 length:279 start_codon:yes stop_codon:yes gene_type:complete